MTHDPREALEPCPFCNGEAEIHRRGDHRVSTIYRCTNCGCRLETGEEFSHGKRWNERAITASAPKAEPAADWSNLPKDIYVTGAERVDAVGFDVQCCSVPMVTAPEVRYVRADMISIKPLEWSGRSSNGKIHKAYVVPMEYWAWENAGFGYWSWGSLAGREVYGGLDGAKAAAQADYESRIFSALSTPPAAVERYCEVCGGDCASANPPVAYCPVKERKQCKEAVNKAREMLKLGINIQTTGNATNVIVTGIVRSLLDCIDDLEADLKCAIAVGRMAARPSPVESNASAEARLREALVEIISLLDKMAALHPSRDFREVLPDPKGLAARARLLVGDEAKKSEGGSRKQPFDPADAAGVKSGTVTFDGQTGRPNRDEVGASQTPGSSMSFAADKPIAAEQALRPSDPTAERREIVARSMVLHDPNYTIYHMPGETPRKWKATSGAILYTSELSEDHAEKVRKRADAILAALDGGAGE